MDDEPDLESFIANIESLAPQEEIDELKHRCQECDTVLEEIDGQFICPGCSTQATNIVQMEQSELHCDDAGRIYLGQQVSFDRKHKHKTDYGWAWSTDDAIVHILSLQIESLEKLGLVPANFRASITNMWLKYWLENVAPFIRDEYNENDLSPFKTTKALKSRDIEVLIKVKDKVMIPEWASRKKAPLLDGFQQTSKRRRSYKMCEVKFEKTNPLEVEHELDQDNYMDTSSEDGELKCPPQLELTNINEPSLDSDLSRLKIPPSYTKNISRENINILTINRTLAFIEATARLMELDEPLFAADIVRACVQRLLPFYGIHKALPENMKINAEDRLFFQLKSPPSANQLTRATSHLIYRVYKDRFPKEAPVPKIEPIMRRFIEDLNLPHSILEHLQLVNFLSLDKTRQVRLFVNKPPSLQHYDRWAFAMLVCQLKRIFVLDDESLSLQHLHAQRESDRTGGNYFIVRDWLRQLSVRLRLIMTYDPYVLHHPMANIRNLEPTSEMFKYIEMTLSDKTQATTRLQHPKLRNDTTFRAELTEFLKNEIPKPHSIACAIDDDCDLEKPTDLRHPIRDSLRRTQAHWIHKMEHDHDLQKLIFEDFSNRSILLPDFDRRWSISDTTDLGNLKMDISLEWPYFFRLLLAVGGFICYCDARDLLREVKSVEQYLYPSARTLHKRRNMAIRQAQRNNRISPPVTRQESPIVKQERLVVH